MKTDMTNRKQSHLSSLLGRGWGRTSWVWALFLALILTGCSSSDADDEQPPVQPSSSSSLTPGSDARPSWAFSDNGLYELRMTVQVELGDSLAYYQSSQDLMCAMIGGEVRAVAVPQETAGVIYYPLIIFSNGDSNTVSLSYYCDKLHRIYTISNWASFNTSAAPTGDSGMYRPRFLSEK